MKRREVLPRQSCNVVEVALLFLLCIAMSDFMYYPTRDLSCMLIHGILVCILTQADANVIMDDSSQRIEAQRWKMVRRVTVLVSGGMVSEG